VRVLNLMLELAVPLPVLPPRPESYSPSVVTLTAGVVAALGIIGFLVVSLAFEQLLQRGRHSWSLMGISFAMMVGGIGVAYLTQTADERAWSEAYSEYTVLHQAATLKSVDLLEVAYGVTFQERAWIPVTADDRSTERLMFLDGHYEDCFVVTLAAEYEIRCGSPSVRDSTPLPLLS